MASNLMMASNLVGVFPNANLGRSATALLPPKDLLREARSYQCVKIAH